MDRRNFLKKGALGTLGITLVPSLFTGCQASPTPPAVIGRNDRLQLIFEPYDLKLKHAFNLAKSSRTHTPDVLVQLRYGDYVGYGEASMPPYLGETQESVCTFLSQLRLDSFADPFRMEEILDYVDSIAPDNRAAKASVDIALHDLVGKMLGQPWYRIWGLSPERTPKTSFTIGIDTEEVVRKKLKEADAYHVLKIKMGLDNDKELVRIIRSETDRPICVDANQGWNSKEYALEMLEWLSDKNCLFVEQPMPKERIDDQAWLHERSPLPLIADEFLQRLPDVRRAYGLYDGINIKLMKSTGMREAYQMAVLAHALDMKILMGCMTETSCAISAAAQLAPMVDWADLDGNLLIANDRFDGMKIVDGKVTLNDRPGIGIIPL